MQAPLGLRWHRGRPESPQEDPRRPHGPAGGPHGGLQEVPRAPPSPKKAARRPQGGSTAPKEAPARKNQKMSSREFTRFLLLRVLSLRLRVLVLK